MEFPVRMNAYDAVNRRFVGGILREREGKLEFTRESDTPWDVDLYLAPGFIDMHVHFYDGYGIFGMDGALFGHNWGVHVLSDAGSCGFDNIGGFYRYIMPEYRKIIIPKLWIHINRFGLPSNHESIDFATLDPKLAAKTALAHREDVAGIKVRLNCDIPEKDCLVPLDRALEAAELAGMPLMVHISQGPPNGRDILPRLRKGDIVTHIFNGKAGSPWKEDGAPSQELLDAADRGVLFDIGHGYSSFNFKTCKGAFDHGFKDVSISTDMHKKCFLGVPFTLTDVMSKVHACGLTLEETVRGVTSKPADMLKLEGWADFDRLCDHGTIFTYRDNQERREFVDAFGNSAVPEKVFRAQAVVINGEYQACDDLPPVIDIG